MSRFKIGSFNLFNLVLANHNYYGNKKYSEHDYIRKTDWIKAQVQEMSADIIGFQEVFHKEALQAALDGTQFSNDQIHVLGETGQSPVVGLASTYQVVGEPESITDIPPTVFNALTGIQEEYNKFSRPILKVKLALSDTITMTVFVCHLKSKRPSILNDEDRNDFTIQAIGQTRALLRRAVEASGLRALVLDELAGNDNPVVVIGDLNDSTRAVTSSIIAGQVPWKFDSRENKKRYWDSTLYSVFDIISQKSFKKEWPTYIYNGHYETLDHIYLSQEFYFRNRDRFADVDFVHIHDDHIKDNTLSRDRLPKWQSDHGQVVVTINIRK